MPDPSTRSSQKLSGTRALALVSSFAVLYTILRMIPTFPMVGVARTFSASDILPPILGVILGPYLGGGSIVIGTFLSIALGRPTTFLGLDFLPAVVNTFVVGMVVRRRRLPALAVLALLLLAFILHPYSSNMINFTISSISLSIPYLWLHALALLLMASPLTGWVVGMVERGLDRGIILAIPLLGFIGTMAQHVTGGLLFETIFGLYLGEIKPEAWPGIWTAIFFVYPIERLVLTYLSSVVGIPAIITLKKAGIGWIGAWRREVTIGEKRG